MQCSKSNINITVEGFIYNAVSVSSIRTLGEYNDLYLKTNILLLGEVFENFRDSCITNYGFDRNIIPGFMWDMMKYTGIKFELLTDIDVIIDIRGSLSWCSHRYAQINNKYMQSYDQNRRHIWCILTTWLRLDNVSIITLRRFLMGWWRRQF